MAEKVIMAEKDIRRAVVRIAHEIVERNKSCGNLVFVGVRTRGAPLARRIIEAIDTLNNEKPPIGILDISLYRDDLPYLDPKPGIPPTHIPTDITGKCVILVDDVLYTGRSTRAAMDALIDLGRPQSIQLAVLVDRGHRELPIRADYVGKNIPTSRDEMVQVRLRETDGRDEVAIVKSAGEQEFIGKQ